MQVLDCLLEAQVKEGDTCVIVFPSLSPSTPAYVMPAPDHDDAFKALNSELKREYRELSLQTGQTAGTATLAPARSAAATPEAHGGRG